MNSALPQSGIFSPLRLLQELLRLPRTQRYWVAFSGGCDSMVLLHALVSLRGRLRGVELCAVHVNHGMSPDAEIWTDRCREICTEWGVPYWNVRVSVTDHGQGLEAAARHARYEAFAELLAQGDVLLTAHHVDDQAETVLLQLLRGAGPKGLAGMPRCTPFAKGHLARPLLDCRREDLLSYAKRYDLFWIEDHSNFDTAYDRNFLRHEILPYLRQRWPGLSRTVARVARHQGQVVELLEDLARLDLAAVQDVQTATVSVAAMRLFSAARQRNVLRYWLQKLSLPMPSEAQIERISHDVMATAADREAVVSWPGAQIRRYRDRLFALPPLPAQDASRVVEWPNTEREVVLGAGLGRLAIEWTRGQGLKRERVTLQPWHIRFRRGGEKIRPAGQAHRRSLKKLFQEWGVAPWLRDRIPLLYVGEELVMVVGFVIAEGYQADAGDEGYLMQWLDCPAYLAPFIEPSR